VGKTTFTFGAGTLREAGPQALEQGLGRVADFTYKHVAAGESIATVRPSLAAANITGDISDEV
jgi:hypothetical protein